MDDKSFNIRVPKRWVRVAMIVGVTALIVAPLTAIASHSFTDVPDSNTFHSDIEWMKDSGVTKGCNPPANTEYCPDDNVTRGQMAAFMNRFAGYIGATDGTPAQADNATTADNATNADTLDGLHVNQIARATGFQATGIATIPSGNTAEVGQMPLSTSLDCMLLVQAAMDWDGNGDPSIAFLQFTANGTPFGPNFADQTTSTQVNDIASAVAHTDIPAGTHTIGLEVSAQSGEVAPERVGMTGVCVPFDSSGGPVSAAEIAQLQPSGSWDAEDPTQGN